MVDESFYQNLLKKENPFKESYSDTPKKEWLHLTAD